MDGLVIIAGAGVLLIVACWLFMAGLGRLVQHLERQQPDAKMPVLRSFVRRGCDFDRQKYLACQLRLAHRRLLQAQQRHRDVHACLYPMQEALIQREAAIRSGAAPSGEFTIGRAFYHGQARAALRRVQ